MFNSVRSTAADREPYRKDNEHYVTCKLKCCLSCSYCTRAITKERYKSRVSRLSRQERHIKICQKCFFCHSIVLCQSCYQCPQCCHKSACRNQTTKFLENLAGSGCRSESGTNIERGLYPPLSDPAKADKVPYSHQLLWQSSQEQLPARGITSAYDQKRHRTSKQTKVVRFLQQTVLGSQTGKQMETYPRPKQPKPISQGGKIQNGDTGNHQDFPPTRGVGDLNRLQGRLLPHTNTRTVQKISEISCPGADLPVQGSPFRAGHSALGVYYNSKGGKTDGTKTGYKNPPVPRRLVGQSFIPPGMSASYTETNADMPEIGLAGEHRKVRIGAQTNLQLCRLPIRPSSGPGQTHSGPVAESSGQDTAVTCQTFLLSPGFHVSSRLTDSHRKAGPSRSVAHETSPMASQKQLEDTGIVRKDNSSSKISTPTLAVVAERGKCPHRPTPTSSKTRLTDLYRRVKRRLGRSFKRTYCKRGVVHSGKQTAHKLSGTQSRLPSLKAIPGLLFKQDSPGGHRQHHCGGLHKQGRRHEVRPTMCTALEDPNLVQQEPSDSKGASHPRPVERGSRQAIQARADYSDRMVSASPSVRPYMQQVASTSNRSFCHQIQHQTPNVCVTGARSDGHCSGRTESVMGGSGRLCFPTSSHLGQSGGETSGLPLQKNDSYCPRVAEHDLVLGPGGNVQPNPTEPASFTQPPVSTLQSNASQESHKSKSPCLAPRATAIKKQGFSEAVAARIEAPQRGSTRSVYEAKWTIFTKWCITNKVDFRAPPVKSVAEFLMYLFEDRKLQPSTIDGYRSAIADKLGNSPNNLSKDENLTRLLDSFHRDRPKGRRGIPSWNLSLVLHQLTKPPFEPLKDATLKHLTFKTVFLLALGSGKRRSEIHAWQNKNIRHQSDWSKVSLYPSPSFLSKNQLAKEGPDSVAPVVIPALAPTLDKSLKSDRSLCPVRALRYYLDRTSDIRQNKELVFVSFKKGFDKDISPATISSWIKQTVILCYELSDQEAHTLHQVKAHDVRAFAASKAFQSGISLEQILSACHWKSHNTFTQFYLKDVAWADTELFHLGPVVAAQQIHPETKV